MRSSIGCGAILAASCAGCCCGRLPTFGFGPEVDEAAIHARLIAAPFVVDGLCTTEAHCEAVQSAEIEVVPVGWNPLTGSVTALVAVEASCSPSTALHEQLQPIVCSGVVGAWKDGETAAWAVTEWAWTHLPPSGLPRGAPSGGGGDWDWD